MPPQLEAAIASDLNNLHSLVQHEVTPNLVID